MKNHSRFLVCDNGVRVRLDRVTHYKYDSESHQITLIIADARDYEFRANQWSALALRSNKIPEAKIQEMRSLACAQMLLALDEYFGVQ